MPEDWTSEATRIWEEIKAIIKSVNRHRVDIYEGRDAQNPPITMRLSALETRVNALELKDTRHDEDTKSRQKELRGYIIGLIVAVVGDALVQLFKH